MPNQYSQSPVKRHVKGASIAMSITGALAAFSLLAQTGFVLPATYSRWLDRFDILLAFIFFVRPLIEILRNPKHRDAVVLRRRTELAIIAAFAISSVLVWIAPEESVRPLAWAFHQKTEGELFFGLVKIFLLLNVCVRILRALQRVFIAQVPLEVLLAGSFAALIAAGTLLLLMPRAVPEDTARMNLLDAFFTATSAACVTGLAVRDTGSEFSTLGQYIILALIQIGGLGIVTFVAFLSTLSKRTLPVPQMVAFRQMINIPAMGDMKRRIAGIVFLTLIVEGAGALALFVFAGYGADTFERMKWSLFHAVSAFCNAGFALQPDSLESARTSVSVNVIIMILITLGSLGALVLPELITFLSSMAKWMPGRLRRGAARFRTGLPPRLTIQSRLSLWVTVILIVTGTVGFWFLESGYSLAGRGVAESFLVSIFQSVTTRTAGFNTIPMGDLQQSSLLVLIFLMIVGGCPVSTAGGIKTVTLGVLLVTLRSVIHERSNVEVFGRTLPSRALFMALTVTVLYAATAGLVMLLLSITDPEIPIRDVSFETISALSTVGLSTGITSGLSTGGKLVLCVAMFIGRVGPLAFVVSVFQSKAPMDYEFPPEEVIVG